MPGVPSSKGCSACRKQKKNCDQTKPTCGRCARLGLDCVGGGQQRYKFMAFRTAATTTTTTTGKSSELRCRAWSLLQSYQVDLKAIDWFTVGPRWDLKFEQIKSRLRPPEARRKFTNDDEVFASKSCCIQ